MNKILNNDLKMAAYHESGHLVVVRNFGGDGVVVIKPTFTDNIKYEKAFIGEVNYFGIGNNIKQRALIGCAGYISELILVGTDMYDARELWDIEYDELSETDKEFTFNLSDDLFYEAYTLIKKLWSRIEDEALHNITMFSKAYEQYLS
jgi:hypothetical protein